MKKFILTSLIIFCLLAAGGFVMLKTNTNSVNDATAEACVVQEETIIQIKEESSNTIVLSDSHGDHYYINRGLERELNLDDLKLKVLNKSVTLHLPKLFYGTSEYIAQLAINDEVIFTEFN